MTREEVNIDFRVYEDKTKFLGVTEVTLPDISFLTTEMEGAGIAGKVETIILGHIEAMNMTMNMRTLNEEGISLTAPRRHNIELRAAAQKNNTSTGEIGTRHVKNIFVVVPKKTAGGKYAPASKGDPNVEFSVLYWKQLVDGKKLLEIDPLNYICYIDGHDYLASVRDALGE